MQTSTAGIMAIASLEGIVLTPYLDSVGVPTLGIGHTAAAGFPDPKTFQGSLMLGEAIGLFRHDLVKYEAAVNKAVAVPLQQHEFDAIVSWHYNTGAVATASWIKKLNAGDRAGAIKGIMDWRKPASIIPRRTAERDLFKTGKYPEPFATIYPAVNGKVQWSKGKRVDLAVALAQAPAPASVQPVPAPIPAPVTPKQVEAPPVAPQRSLWAALLDLILKLFGKRN